MSDQYLIPNLETPNGQQLINVPASVSVLLELGFKASVAEKLCQDAINATLWASVRTRRDALVSQTDWTQMPDSPLSAEKKAEFAAYRQALRDIPQTFKKPDEVDWPPVPVL